MNLDRFLLFISNFKGVGSTSIRKLINDGCFDNLSFKNAKDILDWIKDHKDYFRNKSGIEALTLDDVVDANEKRKNIEEELAKLNYGYVSYYNENYPTRFKNIEDFPIVLFYKGDISLMNAPKICSIIGTRKPNENAINIGLRVAKEKTNDGYVVMSGLAEGCDSLGHRGCLDACGKTIAITGTGLDVTYPKSNIELEKEILERGGLVITEYPLGFKGASYSFVSRDRLQAAGSDEVIVIQTSVNGGTMHAAKATFEKYSKPLYVIDPILIGEDSDGNELLIREYRGITME